MSVNFLRLTSFNLKQSFKKLSYKNHYLLFQPVLWASKNLPSLRFLNYAPINTENRIEVGHKMTQVIEKRRDKSLLNEIERKKKKTHLSATPVISCSSAAFNHHPGQTYKRHDDNYLASRSWTNRISNGKYFTINSTGSHPSHSDIYQKRDKQKLTFQHLGANSVLSQILLKNFEIETPTSIQLKAYQEILNHTAHNLMLAETGGGKTLAYLLPLMQTAIQLKSLLGDMKLKRGNNEPLAVILVPTRELVYQVYNVANRIKSGSHSFENPDEQVYYDQLKSLNFVCDLNENYLKAKEQVTKVKIESLDSKSDKPVDILITTPACLDKRTKLFSSLYLKKIVLDEADTLLDDSFNQTTLNSLNKLQLNLTLPKTGNAADRLKEPSTQLLFVSATLPRDMKNILEGLINCQTELNTISTNRCNKLLLNVPQRFLRLSADKRKEHLLQLVRKELDSKSKRTFMIFTHRSSTAYFVSKFLEENNVENAFLTKQVDSFKREAVVSAFLKGEVRVLVCTDIASRGWDTVHVNHVVNFEMPPFVSDYLHRVGRVGRLNCSRFGGANGLVTNYVTKAYEVDLVQNIERSVRYGGELHNVNANAKRFFTFKYSPKNEREVEARKDATNEVNGQISGDKSDEDEEESDSSSSSSSEESSSDEEEEKLNKKDRVKKSSRTNRQTQNDIDKKDN